MIRFILSLATVASLLALTQVARAATGGINVLDSLASTWSDLDSFSTLGQCIGSPSNSLVYQCSPAHLTRIKKSSFDGGGIISATDSVLSVADSLRKDRIETSDISSLFSRYNYSDLIVSTELNYVMKGFLVGIRPTRMQGQFQVHNPNLPLVSLALRRDMDIHAAYAHGFEMGDWHLNLGAAATFLYRKESLVEATLLQLASSSAKELIDQQKMNGYFFELGGGLEYKKFLSISAVAKDLGAWLGGKTDHTSRYLFLLPDKMPRALYNISLLPSALAGTFQIGASTYHFFDRPNHFAEQWFGTLSYYVGPLRLLTGFRTNLFRSGLGIRFARFDVVVAQEWVNKLETGRHAQPRFTFGIGSSL